MIGYSTSDYKNVAQKFLPEHPEVQAIILVFCLNVVSDVSASAMRDVLDQRHAAKPAAKKLTLTDSVNEYLRERSKLFVLIRNTLTDASWRITLADLAMYSMDNAMLDAVTEPLHDVALLATERGIRFHVLLVPDELQVRMPSERQLRLPQTRLGAYLRRQRICYSDLLEHLSTGVGESQGLYLPGDPIHFSESSRARVADALSPGIVQEIATRTPARACHLQRLPSDLQLSHAPRCARPSALRT